MMVSLSKTKSGKWACRWRDASGRQRSQTVGYSKRDAELVRADMERRMILGPLYEAPPETLGAYLMGWLERRGQKVRASTVARHRQALKALGVLPGGPLAAESLRTLLVADVEDAATALAARAPRQTQIALMALKMALSDAEDRGQSFNTRLLKIKPPRYKKKDARFLDWEQVEQLASWLPESISRLIPVAALTGLRQGELFGLEEVDLDLAHARLTVRRSGDGPTKTEASERTVQLPALVVELLREQLLARRHTNHRLVFPSPQGGRMHKDNFMARFYRPAAVASGLGSFTIVKGRKRYRGINFHSLRHTYVSLSALSGSSPEVIAKQLGHADGGALLMRTYRHLFAHETQEAALRLEALIRPAADKAQEESA